MVRREGSGAVKIRMPDEMIKELDLAVQYLRLTGQEPQTLSALLQTAFKEWRDRRPDVKAYIDANLSLIEKARSQQGQQAAQEGGP